MSEQPSPKALQNAFDQIEEAARTGARFPANGVGAVDTRTVKLLALSRRILVHIQGHHWRSGTPLEGPYAGKWTQSEPAGGRVYRRIDHNGSRPIPRDAKPLRSRIRETVLPSNSDKPNASPRGLSG